MHHIQFAQKIPLVSPEHPISSVFSFSSHWIALKRLSGQPQSFLSHIWVGKRVRLAYAYTYVLRQSAGSIWAGCGRFIQRLPLAFLLSNSFSLQDSKVCSNIWSRGAQPRLQGRHWLCPEGTLSEHKKYSYLNIKKKKKRGLFVLNN